MDLKFSQMVKRHKGKKPRGQHFEKGILQAPRVTVARLHPPIHYLLSKERLQINPAVQFFQIVLDALRRTRPKIWIRKKS